MKQNAMLADSAILAAIKRKDIIIKPFLRSRLGSNSYDCRLSKHLAIYLPDNVEDAKFMKQVVTNKIDPTSDEKLYARFQRITRSIVLDAKKPNQVFEFTIPKKGLVLYPGVGYLGCTMEYTETHNLVPFIEGKSSSGRLFFSIHETAGKGDAGFCGYWTLEITVTHNLRVYFGMKVAQLIYYSVEGEVLRPYNKKPDAKYSGQAGKPVPSMMWKNFPEKKLVA